MEWPHDNPADLELFFGRHELGANGVPTAEWERENLVIVPLPYPMVLSWDSSRRIRAIRCHMQVADSLIRILDRILSTYGSVSAVEAVRMHVFGGCYSYRRIQGTARLSTHAWGAGLDLDPGRNPLGRSYDEGQGMMPMRVVDIFGEEGWSWGGTFLTRPDCMHFQATR